MGLMTKLRVVFVLGAAVSWLAASAALAEEAGPRRQFDDFLLLPVRVHLLSSPDEAAVATTLTEQDIDRILAKINGIWSQAGVHFWLESLVREEAVAAKGFAEAEKLRPGTRLLALRPDPTKTDRALHLYYIKAMNSNGIYLGPAMFVKDTAELRSVPGGIDEPLPRVSSHEIGHALGLPHRQDTTNLMASGTTGTSLNSAEVDIARAKAKALTSVRTAASVLQEADEAWTAADMARARELYRRVANVSAADGPAAKEIGERIKQRIACQ